MKGRDTLSIKGVNVNGTVERIHVVENLTDTTFAPKAKTVGDAIAITSTSLTYGGKTFTFTKTGRFVVCASAGDISTADNGYNVIGTLPASFRPAERVISRVENVSDLWQFQVETDGTTRLYTTSAVTSAHNCAINAAWISAT